MTAGTVARTTYRDVLAHREFSAVLTAWLISMLGNVLAGVALSYLVFQRTGSSFQAAVAFSIGWLPHLFIGTLLSGLPDRYPPRRLMVGADLLCAVIIAALVIPGMPVAGLLVLILAEGCVSPVFGAARAATVPELLQGDEYVVGQALLSLVGQSSQVLGLALGAALLAVVGPKTALLLDAASFLVSALILRLGTVSRPPRRANAGASLTSDSLRGLRALFADPRIRSLILLGWLVPMVGVIPEALAVPYSARSGGGASGAALLLGATSAGIIVGELVVARVLRPADRVRAMAPLALFLSVPPLLFLWRPSLPVAAGLLLLAGLGWSYGLAQSQLLIAVLPEDLRGRGLTTAQSGMMLTQALGFFAAGAAAELVSPQDVIALGGVVGLVSTGLALLAVRRSGA